MKLKLTFEMDGLQERFSFEGDTWEGLAALAKRSLFIFMMSHEEYTKEFVPAEESNSD